MSDNKGRRALGDPPAGNPYDYEQKYEEDRYGEEFGPNARVWRVFLDEGRAYDTTIVKGWRDTLDVYLVFTGLFSAVVTTFVVQSSQSLQPDYGEINGTLLSELIAIQRASGNGSSVNDVPPAKLTKDSVTADTIDYLANRFWFASLALSLFAALMAVLMRQWLQEYASAVSGSARHRARVWQYRYLGLNKWKVPLMVALLPMLLHISLLMFFVGLILYIVKSDKLMAWVVTALTALFYSLYLLSNILPMIDPQCPYRTPLSHYGYRLFRWVWSELFYRRGSDRSSIYQGLSTPSAREKYDVGIQKRYLAMKSFSWAFSASSDPSFTIIVVRAAPGLHVHWQADWTQRKVLKQLRRQMISWFCNVLSARGGLLDWTEGRQRKLMQFACTLLLLDAQENPHEVDFGDGDDDTDVSDDATSDGGESAALRDCISRVLGALLKALSSMRRHDPDIPVLEATAFALCGVLTPGAESLSEYFPEIFPAPSSALNVQRRTSTSRNSGEGLSITGSDPPSRLRLHPVVWYRMLTCLAKARHTATNHRLHLALFLWSSMNPCSSINPKEPDRSVVTLEWLCSARRAPYRNLAQRAIHRLLFGPTELSNVTSGENYDHSLWMPMLRCAIKEYTELVDKTRLSKQDSPAFDRIVAVLARDLGNFLTDDDALHNIDIAMDVAGRSGVTLEHHQQIFSRYSHAYHSASPSDSKVVELMQLLVKLLSAPVVIADEAPDSAFHFQILRMMCSLIDRPGSQSGPSKLFRVVAAGQPEFLQVLQPLAQNSISNPQCTELVNALGTVLAAYLKYALQLFQDFTKDTVQHVLGAARGEIERFDAGQPKFLAWCIWIDVINTALAESSEPPSLLHTTLLELIGLRPNPTALSQLLAKIVQEPLPLALGMALKDQTGRKIFRDFVGDQLLQSVDPHWAMLDDTTILQTYRVYTKKGDDGKVDEDWCHTVMKDISGGYKGDTIGINELVTLREYRDRRSREMTARLQNDEPDSTDLPDWVHSWFNRFHEARRRQSYIPVSDGGRDGGDATSRV